VGKKTNKTALWIARNINDVYSEILTTLICSLFARKWGWFIHSA
jgi:hypothetical protein